MQDHLSLEEKIGQMFLVGFDNTEPDYHIIDLIENYYIGGVCLFSRNVKDPNQVYQLTTSLQNYVKNKIPLFITIDQEGGMVVRLKKGVTISPGNMAIGATNNPQFAYQLANIVGKELYMMGINMNFAPSVDINYNPKNPVIGVRSFSEDPVLVGKLGIEAIKGYQDACVSAVAKHFPGHGDTETDSHLGLPVVNHSLNRLQSVELFPFKKAIENEVDAIMISHVCFPDIEKQLPATLSKRMISQLLRKDLQFDGVIITDCMEMKAIESQFGIEESVIMAVEAGVDLILISHTYDKQKRAINALLSAVKSGRISKQRIDESIKRILLLKTKRLISEKVNFNQLQLATKKNVAFAQYVSDKSITIVKDDNALLPLDKEKKTIVIWPKIGVTSEVDEKYEEKYTLGEQLKQSMLKVEEILMSNIEKEMGKLKDANQIIIVTYNALSDLNQQIVIRKIVKEYAQKTIMCAFRNPYDLRLFPEVSTFIAAYEVHLHTLESVTKVLLGAINAEGKLPVSINEQFPIAIRS